MGAQRHLTVVLLAGGPGGSTAKDILAATAEPPHVESRLAHRKQLLRGAKGSGYVAPGLTGRQHVTTANNTGKTAAVLLLQAGLTSSVTA